MATRITWLGHATFEIKVPSGDVIMIDPWLEGNPSYPEGHEIERVDLLLITHGHVDHFSDALSVAKRFKPTTVAIYEICQWLGSKGVDNLAPMNKGGSQTINGVEVTMTHAQHSSMIEQDGQLIYAGEAAGYVVGPPDGPRFYHAGDTCLFSDMQLIRELYAPELAMLPIGDLFTMDPRQAALACRYLQPRKVIPIHYGTFPVLTGTPDKLKQHLKDQPGVEVVAMNPGETLEW